MTYKGRSHTQPQAPNRGLFFIPYKSSTCIYCPLEDTPCIIPERDMRPMPNSVIGLIEQLEDQYPPKCKTPDESLEAHAQYAGKVALITHLRDRYEAIIKSEQNALPKVL